MVIIRFMPFLHFQLCFTDSGKVGSDAGSTENTERKNRERRKGKKNREMKRDSSVVR